MSRLARGVGHRSGQALALVALTAVVVGGCLVSTAISQVSDTPAGALGVLLVLGVVVLAVQAAQVAQGRRAELAIAQVRGLGGMRLLAMFVAEPILLILVGAALGVGAGRLVLGVVAGRWLDAEDAAVARELGTAAWVVVGVATAAAVAAVVVGSWRPTRQPVATQLDAGRRPRPPGSWVLLGQVTVIVAAVVGTYQAASGTGSKDGWAGILNPALLSPVLLGLAAGQVVVWLIQGVALAASARTRSRGRIASFLAVRRLARRADSAFGARVMVAAGVVAAITASAASDVSGWQDESTRLSIGGPVSYRVDAGPMAAYDTSHAADPEGRWLMAMTQVPDESEAYRRMFADTERWDAVVGDFFAGTAAAGVESHLGAFTDGSTIDLIPATTASITFDTATLEQSAAVTAILQYLTSDGVNGSVSLTPRRADIDPGQPTYTVTRRIPDCEAGCLVRQLAVDGFPPGASMPLELTSLTFGDEQLFERDTFVAEHGSPRSGDAEQRGSSVFVELSVYGNAVTMRPASSLETLTAVITPGLTVGGSGRRSVGYSVDGSQRSIDVVADVDGLPFLGGDGMMLDLPRAMTSGNRVIPASTSYVVARDDTPDAVLAALEDGGLVSDRTDFDDALAATRAESSAQGVRLYVVMSVGAGLIALIGLASAVAGQRDDRRREAAGLRTVGVRSPDLARSLRVEAAWLATASFAVIAVVGWIGARLTVKGLDLTPDTRAAIPLQIEPSLPLIAAVAASSALLVAVVTVAANRRVARSARPGLLREAAA